jgi:hypothetical protein
MSRLKGEADGAQLLAIAAWPGVAVFATVTPLAAGPYG